MLYHASSPYYQWFLTSQKKNRNKIEGENKAAQQTGKNYTGPKIQPTSA
jgi:hypothetical protein